MITETRFAASHHGFCHDLLPAAESYLRTCNLDLGMFATPMYSRVPASLRGLVNELGFRLFALDLPIGQGASKIPPPLMLAEAERARIFIEKFRQHGRAPLSHLDEEGLAEAVQLADRTMLFFRKAAGAEELIETAPHFRGCGWIAECDGDALWRGTLYEIKAGDRAFRSTDLRQALIYCALAFASKSHDIAQLCLVNPRHGTYFAAPVNDICESIAGRSASEVLGDIVDYVSDSKDSY